MHSFNHLIYCPVPASLPLPILPSEDGIPCVPVIAYEEPLDVREQAHLGILRRNTFKVEANQALCKQHGVSCKDFTFTSLDFATHLPDREAWIIGSQTRPSDIPKHDIDIRFYLDNPTQRFATKIALLQKIESIFVRFIQAMTKQTAFSSSTAESALLKIFNVKIQVFGLPDYPGLPSWVLVQFGNLQINAIYRTRTHSISRSTGGQWNILRSVARWSIGHSFALNSHTFTLAKKQAEQRICSIPYPQFTHNLLYRIMLEASHGSIFLPSTEKRDLLFDVAVDKFLEEHALDFKLNTPITITKNLLRYFKEHASTPYKRLADFLYLLSILQYQPQACALLCQAFLDIARQHDKELHIAAIAPFAEFLSKYSAATPAFLDVLYGLCVCCKWATQKDGAKGEIKAYTFSFAEKRPFFTFKGAFFALPEDYPSVLALSHMLIANWETIFKLPESTKCLQGLFDFLGLSVYLHQDPSISLKTVKEALLIGAKQEHVRLIIDHYHGPGAAEAWFQSLKSPEMIEKESKIISSEEKRLLIRLLQTSESLEKQGQIELSMWFKSLRKLGETPSRAEELLKLLNNLWSHIQALPKKTEFCESAKTPLNDFLRHYLNVLEKQPLATPLLTLLSDFYFSIQDFLSREVSLNFFFTLMVSYEKEHPQTAHRLIIHGIQKAFFSNPNTWLTEYHKLFSSSDPLVLNQIVIFSPKALANSANDKVRLEWLPLLMQKLLEASCYSEACALLLHIRHHSKALLKHFLDFEDHPSFRKQLLEAASLDLRAMESETVEKAYRVLRLILSGTPDSALVAEISHRLSAEISANFSKSTTSKPDIPKPNIDVRYRMLRLVHQLLRTQAILSTDTKIAYFRYIILKCMEMHKKRLRSYREMAVRTLKKMATSSIPPSSESELKLSASSSWLHEVQKTFFLRMKRTFASKVAQFRFFQKVFLENVPFDKSAKKELVELLNHLSEEEFSEKFSAFVIRLDPSLAEHPVFKREKLLPESSEITETPQAEEKDFKNLNEKADIIEDAFIEGINPKQVDASPHFVRMRRAIDWLLKFASPKGKVFSENLLNSRLFIVNSIIHGRKRLLNLPEEARLNIAQNLLQAIKRISEIPRQDAQNEAYELFAFWLEHAAQCFEPLSSKPADLFAQDNLTIASTLLAELVVRAEKEPEKINAKALHFLAFFLLNQNVSKGLAYELLIQVIALLPRKPPFGLAYPQAVGRVRHMMAQTVEPHARALLQKTALKLISEGVQPHAKDYTSLAIQLWGEMLNHRLVIEGLWDPIGKALPLLTDKLANKPTLFSQESLCHFIVDPLTSTQMLSLCSEQTRYAAMQSLTDSLFPEALPKLLPSVKDQLDYLLWRRSCPDITVEQCRLLAAMVHEIDISKLDTSLINMHAVCCIMIYLGCGCLERLNQAIETYQTLDLDEQLKIVSKVLEGFFAYPHLKDIGSDNLGKIVKSLHQLEERAKLTPIFWQNALPKIMGFFGKFKTTPQKVDLEQIEIDFIRGLLPNIIRLPTISLKLLIIRLLETALTFSDLRSTQIIDALGQLSASLPSNIRSTCLDDTLKKFIAKEHTKCTNMFVRFEGTVHFQHGKIVPSKTSVFSPPEIDAFYNKLQRLLKLETIIPIDVEALDAMLSLFFGCALSMGQTPAFSQMSTLLDFASTEGYFRHLESATHLSPVVKSTLKAHLLEMHLMPLEYKNKKPSTPLNTLAWLGKLRNLFPKLWNEPEYVKKTIAIFVDFTRIFLNEDPQKSCFIMQELEALFKLASHKNHQFFALECVLSLVGDSWICAAIPLFIRNFSTKGKHKCKDFMKCSCSNPNVEFPLMEQGGIPHIVTAMRKAFHSYEDVQQILKKVEEPAYFKGIAEMSLQGLKATQRCLLAYTNFPPGSLVTVLERLDKALDCIPKLLEDNLSATHSLSPYKAEEVIKQCAAWRTFWAPAVKHARQGKPLPPMHANIPSDILYGDLSAPLFKIKPRLLQLWEEYKSLKPKKTEGNVPIQQLERSLTSFITAYSMLLLPNWGISDLEACHAKACDLTLQIERLRQKSPPQEESERKVEASTTDAAMWRTLERWESAAVHVADLVTDLFHKMFESAQKQLSTLPR